MAASPRSPKSASRSKPAAPAKPPKTPTALGWTHTARFLTTAAQLHQLPELDVPEIAFVGRSNAGKSTCINTLTQQRQLAYASKTPGRTQHINLFALGRQGETDAVLADLPGYGYASVPLADKLTRSEAAKVLSITRLQAGGGDVMLFSALKKQGVAEVAQLLWDWTHDNGDLPTSESGFPDADAPDEPECLDDPDNMGDDASPAP